MTDTPIATPRAEPATETATLGGGCFWCLDAVYRELRGVTRVVSGYAGGHVENPSYEQVCGKRTGHAEVVEVTFDPAELSYADLLRVFFTIHDPTTPNRQGADVGPQYRSVILYHSEAQKRVAEQVMAEIAAARIWDAPLVTELVPATGASGRFWPAEPEHQDYFARNPWAGYCQVVVAPKVAKFRKAFADRLRRRAA
ncbi:peptide-methionine (S)-S-oxide reductase MsrA [Roseomonas sp. NAR14]|uniref:Peptide methionine sulfoxide reductase MsrA n=1 Tax=Roseomonas acroporae TaxID=2937791 RepID=A0A9X2BVQ0_9PROT|nr:peptide-methionine (S)-S-oxide reductase MsrA [Roseomonas acroporae]MCK8785306.1 peptide-methionine (S)-S-oxide reductase MsrA [Roseomonas acroporae]